MPKKLSVVGPKQRPTITLDDAFRLVFSKFEELDAVPAEERLSQRPENHDYHSSENAVYPEGKRLLELLPDYTSGPVMRNRRPIPARRRQVPVLPNYSELWALFKDDEDSATNTSASEHRICAAHRWLLNELSVGNIESWANVHLVDHEENIHFLGESLAILKTTWKDVKISYRSARQYSAIFPGPLLKSISNEMTEFVAGETRTGNFLFEDIFLDEEQLFSKSNEISSITDQYGLVMKYTAEKEEWFLILAGVEHQLAIPSTDITSLRSLRILAVLLKNKEKPVSCHILEGLKRSESNTQQKDARIVEERWKFWNRVDPIGIRLFNMEIGLDEAHTELLAIYRDMEPKTFLKVAGWPQMYDKDGKGMPAKSIPGGCTASVDKIKKSFDALYKVLKKLDPSGLTPIVDYFASCIEHDSFSFAFKPIKAPYVWEVDVRRVPETDLAS